ncbi:cytochrome c maturation protein CcmE [Paucibacter sp. DJ2R-2]|uniref:cytochrome c maturation protein CcmE n=1 Tax=Paucibacter sp. DJ2R-2 TaxID=2893558 RepID=UPI0021E44232|nr:cytochrome c maturation protein CcmE [Paucibacter sp. DJ2R-2]MCV2422212.1 cytochrome c maturation protein CcmE [Paucibacter sp. DJ4R-1]MCV2440204.1 cytochrome c maturation protein CcmE [Paucibacter sp. DJ2R-2]
MKKTRHRRLLLIAAGLLALGAIAALVMNAFRSNLVFFYTPSQVAAQEAPQGRSFRIGGLVQPGSVRREGVQVQFVISDGSEHVPVSFSGALPDLFKEGKGVVAQGQLQGRQFLAREVLAKHDENYMPPEAADALQRSQQARERAARTLKGSTP